MGQCQHPSSDARVASLLQEEMLTVAFESASGVQRPTVTSISIRAIYWWR